LFSLFHHDVYSMSNDFSYSSSDLYESSLNFNNNLNIKDIGEYIYETITKNINGLRDEQISITLTGGMDSRVVLACILRAGVKPNCLVYGHHNAIDTVISRKIAGAFGLRFHNVICEIPTKEWYYEWVVETIRRDKGNSHLHRAHRTAAIAEHAEIYNPRVLFTGHMGGEGLRGLTYNNYFASPFFESVNEGKEKPLVTVQKVLHHYFHKTENIDYDHLLSIVMNLSWMKRGRERNKFFFLYDLIAKIHHAQDIRIYRTYVPDVVPVFLQQGYLERLFGSSYSFLSKPNGVMGRLSNPYVYCKIIEHIYPELLYYKLANGYTPRDYMKGLWYYVPAKLYHNYRHRKKHPSTFVYGQWYVDFVREHAENVSDEIWEIYDRERYMEGLYSNNHQTDEGYWHKYSNPIYFDLVNKTIL
jgi:hypothetical protein